ncbi:putative glycosyl transferase [Frankia canadensis]|uniref:Putative glycosyl transferase n=1 Tax=Frankia canadensis TaxID=1836972 RepID=A0A2I2KJ41_9ACTN|nr:mycofactocin biosynthesis glycosyltransferase MftF [Frankia canadensis]SNQ45689.1 putative glycosyl transferase [Frankia canadensis]SOU52979.1 putative glycosyl transferase [Frankia canadensis]
MTRRLTPLPAFFRLWPDPGLAVLRAAEGQGQGQVLLGGSPLRLMTLSPAGAGAFARLRAGGPVGDAGAGAAALARRLADAGLLHPLPPASAGAATGTGAAGAVGTAAPALTAVVPARDEARRIGALVTLLRARCAEVIVVDDGSRDATAVAAASAGARVIRHPHPRGPAAARTTGARAARTELIVFCDGDVRPTGDWLERLAAHLADPAVAAAAPRVSSPVPPGGRPGLRARYEAARSPLDLGARAAPVRPGARVSYVPTAALVIRRRLVAFDPALRYGEDVDLVWRLVAAGHTVRYEPAAVVGHEPRGSWWAWARQRHGYGRSAAALARRHPGALRPARGAAATVTIAALLAARTRPARLAGLAGLVVAVASTGRTVQRLARRLERVERPALVALALTARGRGHGLRAAAETARRVWLIPLACAGAPGRLVLAAAAAPLVGDWWAERPDVGLLPYVLLRVADDAAYCAGVWTGCLSHGSLDPLLPTRRARLPSTV